MTTQSNTQHVLASIRRWFTRPVGKPARPAATASGSATATNDAEPEPVRPVKVWDERLSTYRTVDLNNPEDPLWLMAYHIHALGKGVQTGPAF